MKRQRTKEELEAATKAYRRHRASLKRPMDDLGRRDEEHREIMDNATSGWDEDGWL